MFRTTSVVIFLYQPSNKILKAQEEGKFIVLAALFVLLFRSFPSLFAILPLAIPLGRCIDDKKKKKKDTHTKILPPGLDFLFILKDIFT